MLSAKDLPNALHCPFRYIPQSVIPARAAGNGLPDCVIFKSYPALGSFDSGVLMLKAGSATLTNGTFVQYEDRKVTMGATVPGGFLASDRFGGCDFTILRDDRGRLVGAHVFNDGPESNGRAALQNLPLGWSLIGTWESSPYMREWGPATSLLVFTFPKGEGAKIMAVGVSGRPAQVSHVEHAATF